MGFQMDDITEWDFRWMILRNGISDGCYYGMEFQMDAPLDTAPSCPFPEIVDFIISFGLLPCNEFPRGAGGATAG
jgi:hypothetical protein